MSCRDVRGWLHRDTESLTEVERLVLEEHLETCAACRTERAQLSLVRRIGASLPGESIGPRGHQRAVARALMQGSTAPVSERRKVSWLAFGVAGGALAGAAAVALLLFASDGVVQESSDPPVLAAPSEHLSESVAVTQRVAVPSEVVEPDVAVLRGTLMNDNAALAIETRVPEDVLLRASTDVRLRAYQTTVVVGASSEIRRSSVERAIMLERGRVELEGSGTKLIADKFVVEPNGVVAVTTSRAAVKRGSARVLGLDGRLLAVVQAGQSWQLQDARSSAVGLLEHARASFTAKDYAAAERHADAALDASPTRTQAAEARTILAECAQAKGKLDQALERYEAIAARFADLPAGETALFAAVRLEASRNHADAARELAQRYLDRYPQGRFADDARREVRAPR